MSNQIATLENVLINGDLGQLTPQDRVMYYNKVCESTGLNPLTRPFEYIRLNGKLTLYARKDCTDQLRTKHDISIKITCREKIDDVYIVTAQASYKDGRCDESTGAVNVGGLKGEALANAFMKAETKAKRRVTLSVAGLGLLDEHEVESIPSAERVDFETGEVINPEPKKIENKTKQEPKKETPKPQPLPAHKNMADIVIGLFNEDAKLDASEYWVKTTNDEKRGIWANLNQEVRDWVNALMKNAPKQ